MSSETNLTKDQSQKLLSKGFGRNDYIIKLPSKKPKYDYGDVMVIAGYWDKK